MIKIANETFIEYKIHKLDKGIFLCIYETNEIEIIGNYLKLPIKINKSGKRYVMENNKIYFIDKYLDKEINYLFQV